MAAYPMPDPRVGVEVLPWVILAIQGAKVYIIYLIIRRWPLLTGIDSFFQASDIFLKATL